MKPSEFRALREQSGQTQEQIAAEFGVNARTIARWESGEFPIPPPVERLLAILADPDWRRLKAAAFGDHTSGDPLAGMLPRWDYPRPPLRLAAEINDPIRAEEFDTHVRVARKKRPDLPKANPADPNDPLGAVDYDERVAGLRAARRTGDE